jgi:adenosylcobinamide amidohydrolase
MNSKQYANQQEQAYKETLKNAGLNEGDYAGVCLSADRTEYTVTLINGSTVQVPSGFEYDPY